MIAARANDFESWRAVARQLLQRELPPEQVLWSDAQQATLFDTAPPEPSSSQRVASVPAGFLSRAELASEHADPARFAVLYRLLWKLTHGHAEVLADPLDSDTARLRELVRTVREEEHRMQAFVRFRQTVAPDGTEHWIAWFDPAHDVVRRVAPFFARRYPAMRWTLLTPRISAAWDGQELRFGPGAASETAPGPDRVDALFLSYYEQVFNPARENERVMTRHLPARIREQLPEGALSARLIEGAPARVAALRRPLRSAAAALLPASGELPALNAAAQACRACPIGEHASQTVFGEGPANARLMIVGEQPGDEEDIAGKPFVGPAGGLLDELMQRAGLDRSRIYVTNAVKHFKFERLPNKRRLHQRPSRSEVEACQAWLMAEVEAIRPELILCLGATAAQAFCGPQFRVQRDRGKPTSTPWAPWWMATYHPSALLRAPDAATREKMKAELLADLRLAREQLEGAR